MNDKKIWLNGKIVPDAQAKVSIWDRGFLYGDGVYETVRVYAGKIFRGEGHWKRLDHSLAGVRLRIPWSHADLNRACLAVVRANRLPESLVRVTITRGVGEHLGYDPSTCKKPTIVVLGLPIRPDMPELWRKGVSIALIQQVRRNHPKSLDPALKHTNCLNGILAKMESLKIGAFEGVFLNLQGDVAEGTISNLFVVKNGGLKTPPLDAGILEGVTRGAVIEVARRAGLRVLETRVRPADVYGADEVFLTSTTMEAMPVVLADRKKIGRGVPGAVTTLVRRKLRELIQKELAVRLAME